MDEGLSEVRGRVGGLIKKASTGTTASVSLKRIKKLYDILCIQLGKFGGARRNRTDDLFNAIEALSQLSYGPTV